MGGGAGTSEVGASEAEGLWELGWRKQSRRRGGAGLSKVDKAEAEAARLGAVPRRARLRLRAV